MAQITIDTSVPLSDVDAAILALIRLQKDEPTVVTEPAKTPAPAKAPAPKPAPVVEPEPEPEPDEDLIGGGEPTVEDAIAAATALISQGKQTLVKEALKTVGAGRVGNISPDKVVAFLTALGE